MSANSAYILYVLVVVVYFCKSKTKGTQKRT